MYNSVYPLDKAERSLAFTLRLPWVLIIAIFLTSHVLRKDGTTGRLSPLDFDEVDKLNLLTNHSCTPVAIAKDRVHF